MTDPEISIYNKPLSMDERSSLVPLKFDDFNFVLAFKIYALNKKSKREMNIPRELGEIKAYMKPSYESLHFEDCNNVLPK